MHNACAPARVLLTTSSRPPPPPLPPPLPLPRAARRLRTWPWPWPGRRPWRRRAACGWPGSAVGWWRRSTGGGCAPAHHTHTHTQQRRGRVGGGGSEEAGWSGALPRTQVAHQRAGCGLVQPHRVGHLGGGGGGGDTRLHAGRRQSAMPEQRTGPKCTRGGGYSRCPTYHVVDVVFPFKRQGLHDFRDTVRIRRQETFPPPPEQRETDEKRKRRVVDGDDHVPQAQRVRQREGPAVPAPGWAWI